MAGAERPYFFSAGAPVLGRIFQEQVGVAGQGQRLEEVVNTFFVVCIELNVPPGTLQFSGHAKRRAEFPVYLQPTPCFRSLFHGERKTAGMRLVVQEDRKEPDPLQRDVMHGGDMSTEKAFVRVH